jgi:hypothetical protein
MTNSEFSPGFLGMVVLLGAGWREQRRRQRGAGSTISKETAKSAHGANGGYIGSPAPLGNRDRANCGPKILRPKVSAAEG